MRRRDNEGTTLLYGRQVTPDPEIRPFFVLPDPESRPLAKGPIMLQTHGGEIRWRNLFVREIDAAVEWLSEQSRAAAVRWHEQLLEAVRSLENTPQRCGLAPESEGYPGEIRQLLHGKRRGIYRILFEVRGDVVHVLRVRHSAQALLEPDDL